MENKINITLTPRATLWLFELLNNSSASTAVEFLNVNNVIGSLVKTADIDNNGERISWMRDISIDITPSEKLTIQNKVVAGLAKARINDGGAEVIQKFDVK